MQFASRECGQSLSDIENQQSSLKELRDSLLDAVNVVKSQAKHLIDVFSGSEQVRP